MFSAPVLLGADGLGLIAYYDVANRAPKVLHCGNLTCNSGNTITLMDGIGNVGINASLTPPEGFAGRQAPTIENDVIVPQQVR